MRRELEKQIARVRLNSYSSSNGWGRDVSLLDSLDNCDADARSPRFIESEESRKIATVHTDILLDCAHAYLLWFVFLLSACLPVSLLTCLLACLSVFSSACFLSACFLSVFLSVRPRVYTRTSASYMGTVSKVHRLHFYIN